MHVFIHKIEELGIFNTIIRYANLSYKNSNPKQTKKTALQRNKIFK